MLHHGQRITKKEIEFMTSLWPPDEFASLCNAITWASAQRQGAILPSFTERVSVKDKGIDAEYVTLGAEVGMSSSLLSAGGNVLQYKLRDILAQNRSKIVSDLKNEFKIFTGNKRADGTRDYYGALQDIYQRNGHRPVRYILFSNIDLTRAQKAELQAIILEEYDQPEVVPVVVYGAADLAAFLNDLPHLRSAYFVPSRFSTWEMAWKLHQEEKLAEASIGLIGRGSQLTTLQSHLCDSTLRAVIVTGPTGVGKSRLVLEATKCSPTATIMALDPAGMTVSDLLAVESPGAETIVVIDNPDPKKAEEFVRQALSCRELKLVMTLPTAEHVSLPNFRRDPRVKRFPLDPLTDQHLRELLKAAGASFEFGIESWIIAQANGNPGVLLMAAHAPDFRKSTSSFLDDVATTFEQQIRDELGERAVEVLRLISLLTRVNIHAPLYEELATLSSTYESHLEPHAILHEIPRLQRAGVVRVRGEYVEATPTLLANHLAKSALRGRYAVIDELFVTLRRSARFCLLERLRLLDSSEVLHFWDELFSSTGLFADFQAAVSNIQVLYAVTGAASRQVARLLENGFASCSVEEIASLPAETKRSLLFILHDLVFRKSTSKSALNGILVLASSETGHHTGSLETFYSCFHPFQPQCPLPFEERLAFLRAALSPVSSLQTQIIGLRAVIYGLSGGMSFLLHEGNGPEPFSAPPEVTWPTIWNYCDTLFDLLIAFAQVDQPELAELALEGRVTGQAIISATAHFPGDSCSAKRVRLLLETKRVTSLDVEYVLLRYHPWFRTLNHNDYLHLLKVTAEEDLKHAQAVVNALTFWLYHHPKMSKKTGRVCSAVFSVCHPKQFGGCL